MEVLKQSSIDSPQGQISRSSEAEARRALGGLIGRRYRWGLSWKAKLLLLVVVTGMSLTICFRIYPFLAQTQRVDTDVLVVEGWVNGFVIRGAVEEDRHHSYRKVFTTGGPVSGNGGYVNDFQTSASVGAESLVKAGVPGEAVQMTPSHIIGRDRTYNSAVALREWLRTHHEQVRSFNIVTQGAHARRTRSMFKRAFGPDIKVGVIPILSPDFDSKRWWYYSEGTEEVVGETMSYIYATLFFPLIERLHGSETSQG